MELLQKYVVDITNESASTFYSINEKFQRYVIQQKLNTSVAQLFFKPSDIFF